MGSETAATRAVVPGAETKGRAVEETEEADGRRIWAGFLQAVHERFVESCRFPGGRCRVGGWGVERARRRAPRRRRPASEARAAKGLPPEPSIRLPLPGPGEQGPKPAPGFETVRGRWMAPDVSSAAIGSRRILSASASARVRQTPRSSPSWASQRHRTTLKLRVPETPVIRLPSV